jgi:ABC-2 type transport system ATP-binding protein
LYGIAGFVESPRFYPYLSARRNLDLLAALDGPGAAVRVDEVLAVVGLSDRAHQKIGGYSTGMRQRLGIAAALLRDPYLLVLDEPTNGLDPAGVHDLHALIRSFAASGRTVLLSSHDMGEVERLCDSVTIMRRGSVVYSGDIDQLRAEAPAPTYLLSTADDARVESLATLHGRVSISRNALGLLVHAQADAMDAFAIALGRDEIAIRSLARQDTALEALFLRLTGEGDDE